MTPDFEKMNERLEQASLNELMPDFDKEQEWMKISGQLHPQKKRILLRSWSYAAAILLLLAGGGWFVFSLSGIYSVQTVSQHNVPVTKDSAVENTALVKDVPASPVPVPELDKHEDAKKQNKDAVVIKKHRPGAAERNNSTKDIICNGTPCPIQICISQTMRCPNVQPAAISSCSTLEPDQSGKLTYKEHDKIAKNCSLTVNEIEIRSIATGEVILLNANSTPSTAQEVFSYITGQKKGDVFAGVFNSDCNDKTKKHGLRLYNSYGNIIIQ